MYVPVTRSTALLGCFLEAKSHFELKETLQNVQMPHGHCLDEPVEEGHQLVSNWYSIETRRLS